MVTHKTRLLRPKLFRCLEPITPDYDIDCLNCARLGEYGSMWNIVALSYLLKVKVEVIYPAVNGSDNYSYINNNRTFKPPFTDPEKPTITVMWSSMKSPPRNGFHRQTGTGWKPNHFVPLVNTNEIVQMVELPETTDDFKDISNTPQTPLTINSDTNPTRSKSTARRPEIKKKGRSAKSGKAVSKGSLGTTPGVQHADSQPDEKQSVEQTLETPHCDEDLAVRDWAELDMVDDMHACIEPASGTPKPSPPSARESVQTEVECDNADIQDYSEPAIYMPNLSTVQEESSLLLENTPMRPSSSEPRQSLSSSHERECGDAETYHTPDDHSTPTNISNISSDLDDTTEVFVPGPLKKYMDLDEILSILKGPHSALKEIPAGRKDGMYFVLVDTQN